ncbi:MAG: sodium-dependent transporter [Prevotella sp.]|nr:sodium-dependent transporter [Prevotella sp.]
MSERGTFGSKLAIVLATAGSAVGLGNIWRFPFMTGQNGGAAFILVYFACVLLLGIPGMVSEFIVGRHAQSNAARAYGLVGGKGWRFIGYLGILTSTIILGFYAVVAGWCLQYLFASIAGQLNGDAAYVIDYFKTFSSDPLKPCLWGVGFVLITHFVIARGVNDGIEKASKLLMPLLLILLLILVVASCLLPGAGGGIEFLLKPDFSKVSGSVFLEALGQAFFSLSLGTACLCTYASYFKRDTNLLGSATQIALLDSAIAILAGLMIFPAAFSVGVQPDSGPSLIFITLPNVFQQAFGAMPVVGYVISILFYALLVFAALTSTISMHEIGTAFFHEELRIPRRQAAWILTIVCATIAVFCSLSVGAYEGIQVLGLSLMDFCDYLTAQYMLPLGAFLTSIMLGWFVDRQLVQDEFTNGGALSGSLFRVWLFSIRFVVPLCLVLIFLHQFGVL